MYIWKIFDEILKKIIKLEKNVLKNQSLFSRPSTFRIEQAADRFFNTAQKISRVK